MRQEDLTALVPSLLTLAAEAGKAIMDIYDSGPTGVHEKADHSPLTAADLAAHRRRLCGGGDGHQSLRAGSGHADRQL